MKRKVVQLAVAMSVGALLSPARAVTVTESVSTDVSWPGPRPFRGAYELTVQTTPPASGKVRIVVTDAQDDRPKPRHTFVGVFDRNGLGTVRTDLDPAKLYQYHRTDLLSMSPEARRGIVIGAVTARRETTRAEALEMDVEGGDFMHVVHGAGEPLALVLRNPSDTPLSWRGEVVFSEYFGLTHRLPIDVTLAAGERRALPLGFDFSKKGVWRVRGSFTADDGSTATRETRFAVLDRHVVTPKMEKPGFRMGINYHVEWYSPEHRAKTLKALVASGAKLARIGTLHFSKHEKTEGVFDWALSDEIIGDLERAGIAMNCGVYTVPVWARDPAFRDQAGHRRAYAIPAVDGPFRRYCQAVAARYGTRVDYYECGNEWDLVPPEILPIDRALQMQRECYEGIKAGCPDACVIPNGWTLADSCSWIGRPATNPGINEAFAEKAQGWYDVHPVHLHTVFENYEKHIQGRLFPLFRRYGITKPWYANETALNTMGGSEDRTAKHLWMKILYSWAWGSTDYIWYNLKAKGWDPNNSETSYGLILADYRPRATYAAFCALAAALEGMSRDGRLIDLKTRHVYRFKGETLTGFKGVGIAGWDTALGAGGTNLVFLTDATRAWRCDLMGNRTPLAVAKGAVTWTLGETPSVLLLEGASRAEPADPAALADVPEKPLPRKRIPGGGLVRARPDFDISQFWYIVEHYKADPAQQHRCWKGYDDLSAKFWLAVEGRELKIRVDVTDDVHRPGADAVEIALRTRAGRWKKRLDAAGREGSVTTYRLSVPFDEAKIDVQDLKDGLVFGAKVYEDDGLGDDGFLFVPATIVVFSAR